jgi:hypothetical protein
MKVRLIAATLLASTSLMLAPAHAQTAAAPAAASAASDKPLTAADLEGLRADLRSSKKQATAATLNLTDAESTKFWPIYDQYVAELINLNDEKYALIVEYVNTYGKFTDKSAVDFIQRWIDCDGKAAALRSKYVPIVGKVLPGIKTATFFQIDRRLGMAIDLRLSGGMPLLQAQSAR